MVNIPVNKYQTEITDELLASLPQEVQDQLLDAVNNIPYVRSLISPEREYAKDRPRDAKGRIIVDLAHPHILEDMDYFRPVALHFKKYGTMINLKPNANPNSEYGKWLREEKRRCWEGYVRESDGEWVTGYMYWYLNYSPIVLNIIRKGTKVADRIEDMPEVWEGVYLRFHYIEQARNGGLYNEWKGGNHGAELASRGKSKSYGMASIVSHNFILGENALAYKNTTSLVTAYQKEYLTKDGILNKFLSIADFCSINTQFPRKRIKNSIQEMTWKMGYVDTDLGVERGSKNQVIGVSSKDDESKLRGKRAVFIGVEEFGCHIKGTKVLMYNGSIKNVENIVVGDKLMGDDNTPREVLELYNGTDQLYKVTLSNGDYQIVNSHHPVYFKKYNWHTKTYTEHTLTAPELLNINTSKGYYIPKANIVFPNKEVMIDPYLLGLWLGDGDSSRVSIANEDKEVLDWLSSNYEGTIRDLKQSETCKVFHIPTHCTALYSGFYGYNLINNKHVPIEYKINSNDIQLKVVAGLIDTDGTYNRDKNFFEITQRHDRLHILEDIKFMCESNGLRCSLSSRIGTGKKPGVLHYRLRISGNLSIIPTKIERKKGVLNNSYKSRNNWSDYTFKVEPYEEGEYYGFTVDKNNLFVLGDLTVTHNTFPRLVDLYNVLIPSVQEGDIVFGFMYLQGTAGDNESDFAGAAEIMYNPIGYNMYALPNVYDREGKGKRHFVFFFPGYISRKGCYNKDGVSDVIAALIEILMNRYRVKYNSSDPNTIVKTIAEVPITPAEAIVKTGTNMFPVPDLTERLNQIDSNPREYDDVYVGELNIAKNGEVEFKPTYATPIREYPLKDNKAEGAIEILKMPEKGRDGKVFNNRYILSCDPYDDDSSDTMSLGSIYVLDLWTDKHVAYYTGRPQFADDFYEIGRRMCLFYNGRMNYENNKKGMFAYFSRRNCLYLLTDVLDFLKDKDMVKGQAYGNKAKGTNATAPINAYGRMLLRNWLLKPVPIMQIVDGEEQEVIVPNLYTIRDRALLRELIDFNPDGNFDRISSHIMLMLLREDKLIMYQNDLKKAEANEKDPSYLGNDKFFEANYRRGKRVVYNSFNTIRGDVKTINQ